MGITAGLSTRWMIGGVLLLGCLASASTARAATPEQTRASIRKAVEFLYAQQNAQGNWEQNQQRTTNKHADINGAQWGGGSAQALLALLAAGESPQDPRIQKAAQWVGQADIIGVYALSMRMQVYPYLRPTQQVRDWARRDAELMYKALKDEGDAKGMYSYWLDPATDKSRFDHSCSQIAVLGMWAAAQMNLEIARTYWATVDQAWRQHQNADGSWDYSLHKTESSKQPAMTAAGIATLFITQDFLNRGMGGECAGNRRDENIDKGLAWMSHNFERIKSGRSFYTLYGIERIGVASGRKYFGTTDWFQEGAEHLVKSQNPDGSWDEAEFTGTGFPCVFYLKYHLYRNYFPLYALARLRNLKKGITEFRAVEVSPDSFERRNGARRSA